MCSLCQKPVPQTKQGWVGSEALYSLYVILLALEPPGPLLLLGSSSQTLYLKNY